MGVPERMILHEYSEVQTAIEMLDKMILLTQMLEHTSMNGVPRMPDGTAISKEFILRRMNYDGFLSLLQRVPGEAAVITMKSAIDAAYAQDNRLYKEKLKETYVQLLQYAFTEESADIKPFLESVVQKAIDSNGAYLELRGSLEEMSVRRERLMIQKIEQELPKRPGVKSVIMIFGKIHYDRLKAMIEASPILSFDQEFSNADIRGGRRKGKKGSTRNKRRRSYRKKKSQTR
jgi:hypothetical protein